MAAFLSGLEQRVQKGLAIDHIASVASFFISRLDTKIDGQLQKIGADAGDPVLYKKWMGQAAVANARLAYDLFKEQLISDRFEHLKKKGAHFQTTIMGIHQHQKPRLSGRDLRRGTYWE